MRPMVAVTRVLAGSLLCVVLAGCPAAGEGGGALQRAEVVEVIDGDTIVVLMDGEEIRVRYIGIDAPEAGAECYASEAEHANAELVARANVELERDVSDTDRFGRLLRYVWVETDDGRIIVNAELVRGGFAEARDYPPDVRRSDELEEAESAARDAGLGIWGEVCS